MDTIPNKPKKNHLCTTALIFRDGKVLMGLRNYEKTGPLWTFPGGRCDIGETPENALKREVAEETGITDLIIKELVGEKEGAHTSSNGITDKVFIYHCLTKQEPTLMEPEKFSEWQWIDPNKFPDNLIDQKDKDFVNSIVSKL